MTTPTRPSNRALGGLGDRLRAAREAAGLSGSELAERLGPGWRQPKISKMETGRQLIAIDDVVAWAEATGADPVPLIALRAKAAAEYTTYKDRLAEEGGLIPLQDEITALNRSCTFLAEYQPALVPGLLQTPDYIREKALGNPDLTDDGFDADDVGHMVAAKMRRQAILYEPGREFVYVVGEAALRMRFAAMTTATLRAQVLHLARMSALPRLSFAVVPFTVGSPVSPMGFALYDRDLVRVETSAGLVQITEPEAVARHVRWLDHLLEVALIGADAARFCDEVAETLPA